MNYDLIKDVLDLVQQFELENHNSTTNIDGFKKWVIHGSQNDYEPDWEGKKNGRSAESVINTLIVHMNRYAKYYSKSAIYGSDFSSQEEFIYLINLKASGPMSKIDLIRKNVHEKPVGMQIINRLITQKWVHQTGSETDKRRKVISVTQKGLEILEKQMNKIRQATTIVTGDLTHSEKMELIRLLTRLNAFHQPFYDKNIEPQKLLNEVSQNSTFKQNTYN